MSIPQLMPLPREPAPGTPVFAEPWQAEVLGIASTLVSSELFSAAEWEAALGDALRHAAEHGLPDTDDTYYRAALGALEEIVARKSPETAASLEPRVEAWRRAYENTPHGRPVELAAGLAG